MILIFKAQKTKKFKELSMLSNQQSSMKMKKTYILEVLPIYQFLLKKTKIAKINSH